MTAKHVVTILNCFQALNTGHDPPPKRDEYLNMYIKAVQQEIIEAYKKQPTFHHKLSISEKKSLKTLSQRTDIVIKPADKGGAKVILNQLDNVKEAQRQLSDSSFYIPPENDPTADIKETVTEQLT